MLLGVCARTFRRYVDRYEEAGLDGLRDQRLSQVSYRRAPVDEVLRLVDATARSTGAGQGQLRTLRKTHPAGPGGSASLSLHEGEGAGAALSRWAAGHPAWAA